MLTSIVLIIVLILVFLVLLIDYIPQFNTWQSRIHIGRYQSPESWNAKVLEKSLKWLRKTPTIKLTDNYRLIVIDILKGNYHRDAIQHWQEAALLLGLYENYKKSNDSKIKNRIDAYIVSKIDHSGNWKVLPKEIDGVILSYAILSVDWVDHDKNKPAYDAMWALIQDLVGQDGTAQYRKTMKNYRYVDTIGFICPFLITYGIKFGNETAVNLGIKQITEFNKYGMFEDKFIPCHTYTISNHLPVGLFGWGRGLGWYAIGLIDAWKALPDQHQGKKELTDSVIAFAKMGASFQNDNGSWNWIVSSKEARADSSTTATLAWFFSNASEINSISESCILVREKALNYLMKVTRRCGAVDFSQGDTKAIGVHSQEFDILPFSQGFALRTNSY